MNDQLILDSILKKEKEMALAQEEALFEILYRNGGWMHREELVVQLARWARPGWEIPGLSMDSVMNRLIDAYIRKGRLLFSFDENIITLVS